MVKSIISIISVAIIIFGFTLIENFYVTKEVEVFSQMVDSLYLKVDDKSATQEDVTALQTHWQEKKKLLHVFISHNDIKEIDLWLAETITLVNDEKWEDARSKVKVLSVLSKQVPFYFNLSLNNLL